MVIESAGAAAGRLPSGAHLLRRRHRHGALHRSACRCQLGYLPLQTLQRLCQLGWEGGGAHARGWGPGHEALTDSRCNHAGGWAWGGSAGGHPGGPIGRASGEGTGGPARGGARGYRATIAGKAAPAPPAVAPAAGAEGAAAGECAVLLMLRRAGEVGRGRLPRACARWTGRPGWRMRRRRAHARRDAGGKLLGRLLLVARRWRRVGVGLRRLQWLSGALRLKHGLLLRHEGFPGKARDEARGVGCGRGRASGGRHG